MLSLSLVSLVSLVSLKLFAHTLFILWLTHAISNDVSRSKGPGLNMEEARSHMTMWVMAASPLLTNNDVRVMSDDILEILTNPEVLAVHKDPLTKMASRIDVGGGVNEPHTASLDVTWSSYGKPLADGSTAVMVRENL